MFLVQTSVYGLPLVSVFRSRAQGAPWMTFSRSERRSWAAVNRCIDSFGSSRNRFRAAQSAHRQEIVAGRRKSAGGSGFRAVSVFSCSQPAASQRAREGLGFFTFFWSQG